MVRIEDEIHQAKFTSARQKAMVNLLYTYGWVIEKMKQLLADVNITHQQFNILRILRGSHPKPLSTLQIRERMLDKMSDTSRIVDRLVLKKLAEKRTCTKDKRLVDVLITAEGLALLKKIDEVAEPAEAVMNGLSETEAASLSNLLDQLRTTKL